MKKQIAATKKGIALMLLSSLCACVGQLLWKLSGGSVNLLLAAGFGCYGAGALLMLSAYRYGSVSALQPLLSMNYVFALLFAHAVLGESITLSKAAGVAVILAGVVCIAGDTAAAVTDVGTEATLQDSDS